MKNEKTKIILLVIFDFLIVISMIILNIAFKTNIAEDNTASQIVERSDLSTAIYITTHFSVKNFIKNMLLFIAIDSILLTVIKIVEYIKNKKIKYGIIIFMIFNLINGIVLLPSLLIVSILLNIIIVFVIVIKTLYKKFK